MTGITEHESKSYETVQVIVGLLFKFTPVKMRGPNKIFNNNNKNLIGDFLLAINKQHH